MLIKNCSFSQILKREKGRKGVFELDRIIKAYPYIFPAMSKDSPRRSNGHGVKMEKGFRV